MMDYFMLRSFDHAGYYETRLILMIVGIAVALYFAARRRDYRYLVMFASGVFFQAVLEHLLQRGGMRGANYSLSVFGVTLAGPLGRIYQGCVEGGILSLMGFWFVALRTDEMDAGERRARWRAYLAVCVLIVALASVVGALAASRPISSPRPMFTRSALISIAVYILISLLLCWWKGGLRYLAYFYLGLVVYVFLTFETLHVFGARYIGVRAADGQIVAAPGLAQVVVMFISHLWEVAGGKLHYFAVPFALGLLKFKGGKYGSDERVPVSGLRGSLH